MTKRMLLLVVVLTVFTAPALMADHCFKCKIVPAPEISYCVLHTNPNFMTGWTECFDDEFGCYPSGNRCYGHAALSASLGVDYTVASVERLDDPQPAKVATVVADAAPATR